MAALTTRQASNTAHALDQSGSFFNFQRLVDRIADTAAHTAKTQLIADFLSAFTGDVYLFYKLLLVKEDLRVYNMRKKQALKILAGIWGVSLEAMKAHLTQSGSLGDTAKEFFKSTSTGQSHTRSTLTLREVDDLLEAFTRVTRENEQREAWNNVLREATPNDLRMFCSILLKDLKASVGAPIALAALHPQAYDALKSTSDLKLIVDRALRRTASSALADDGAMHVGVQLYKPFKPMLARACKSVDEAMRRCPDGFFCETKYDGERILIHKGPEKTAWFSRNQKPVTPWKIAHVKEYVDEATKGMTSAILDGEILLVDTNTGVPLPFATFSKHKNSQFQDAAVCIFLFDCLYLNGDSIMHLPIENRRRLLTQNVTPIPNHIHMSEMAIVHAIEDLTTHMNRCIRDGLEGLVLKPLGGDYKPNKRHWLKLKKDYMEGMSDTADLVCIGGYYGTGAKGGVVSTFLMGALDRDTGIWKTVCKAGNGFDDQTLEAFQTTLKPMMIKISKDPGRVPSWLSVQSKHVPDYIARDPKAMPVWEIEGAEFSDSTSHTASGISIRFPRIIRQRTDKDWTTHTDVQQLKVLKQNSVSGNVQIVRQRQGRHNDPASQGNIPQLPMPGTTTTATTAATTTATTTAARSAPATQRVDATTLVPKEERPKQNQLRLADYFGKGAKKGGKKGGRKGAKTGKDREKEKEKEKEKERAKEKGVKRPRSPKPEAAAPKRQRLVDGSAAARHSAGSLLRMPRTGVHMCEGAGDVRPDAVNLVRPGIGDLVQTSGVPVIVHVLDGAHAWRADPSRHPHLFADPSPTVRAAIDETPLPHATHRLVASSAGTLALCACIADGALSVALLQCQLARVAEAALASGSAVHVADAPRDGVAFFDRSALVRSLRDCVVAKGVPAVVYLGASSGAVGAVGAGAAAATAGSETEDFSDSTEDAGERAPTDAVHTGDGGLAALATCRVVVSAGDPAETKAIRDLAVAMGAEVQPLWRLVGARSTHLVVGDTPSAQTVAHVQQLGGVVVGRSWLEACRRAKACVDEQPHLYTDGGVPQAVPMAVDATTEAVKEESEPADLPNPFSGVHVLLHKVDKADKARRYLVAYDAHLCEPSDLERLAGERVICVTDREWGADLETLLAACFSLQVVGSRWLWDSVRATKLLDVGKYFVRRPSS